MKTNILLLVSVIGLAGCACGMQDEVIARSDELSRRPEWVKDDEPNWIGGMCMWHAR